jgi:hypothetical protein
MYFCMCEHISLMHMNTYCLLICKYVANSSIFHCIFSVCHTDVKNNIQGEMLGAIRNAILLLLHDYLYYHPNDHMVSYLLTTCI